MTLDDALQQSSIIANIRGVTPGDAEATADALYRAGVRVVEVPLNSPDPLDSIRRIAAAFEERMVVGAGTVLSPDRVDAVAEAGGRIIVSPNTDAAVIEHTARIGLIPFPGFGSVSEAFRAYQAGARRLKLFPASTYGAGHLKALLAVLPRDASVYAVGGVGPDNMAEWIAAGARGFGLGSELYRPGQSAEATFEKARLAVAAAKG
jgi:2-dehydro-3-deoxyphosphogalactonate aldolase